MAGHEQDDEPIDDRVIQQIKEMVRSLHGESRVLESLFSGPGVERMRDPKRIPQILRVVAETWHASPDLRLGQLLIVASGNRDPFRIEDEELCAALLASPPPIRGCAPVPRERLTLCGLDHGERQYARRCQALPTLRPRALLLWRAHAIVDLAQYALHQR